MSKLAGRIALVTGGTSGLGLATAKRFAADGAFVFITGSRLAQLDAAVAEIGAGAFGIQGDVSNLADLDRIHEVVRTKKRRLDVLFANAGGGGIAPLAGSPRRTSTAPSRPTCAGCSSRSRRRCR